MIRIHLVTVGKLKEKFFTDAVNEYKKRISRFADFDIIEINEERTLKNEADNIIKKLKGYTVVFDLNGKTIDSTSFSEIFSLNAVNGISEFSFVIGSSEGLDESVKKCANMSVSFGKVTYPHQLMRVIAAEQIYRALTIINNVTYHK